MSDTSQGEGWWQASDGKWYPPQPENGGVTTTQYCTNCGTEVSPGAAVCMSCGFNPLAQRNFCAGCGSATTPGQVVCTSCGRALGAVVGVAGAPPYGAKNKVAAGLLGIFLGWAGAHKFYLGRTNPALIMLLGSLGGWIIGGILLFVFVGIFLFLVPVAMSVIGLVEGIIYLTKTDQQFYEEYVVVGKDWF